MVKNENRDRPNASGAKRDLFKVHSVRSLKSTPTRSALMTTVWRKWFTTAGAVFALAFASTQAARGGEIDTSSLRYTHIADLVGGAHETLNDFVLRIGPTLRAFSDKTGYEACGEIARTTAGRYSVMLGTSKSHIGCAEYAARVLPGYAATGITIHSHGRQGMFNATPTDRNMLGMEDSGPPLLTIHGQNLAAFSPQDYKSGPGFLATPTGVIEQNGDGTSHSVKPDVVMPATATAVAAVKAAP